jgi:hypothetical protein
MHTKQPARTSTRNAVVEETLGGAVSTNAIATGAELRCSRSVSDVRNMDCAR